MGVMVCLPVPGLGRPERVGRWALPITRPSPAAAPSCPDPPLASRPTDLPAASTVTWPWMVPRGAQSSGAGAAFAVRRHEPPWRPLRTIRCSRPSTQLSHARFRGPGRGWRSRACRAVTDAACNGRATLPQLHLIPILTATLLTELLWSSPWPAHGGYAACPTWAGVV